MTVTALERFVELVENDKTTTLRGAEFLEALTRQTNQNTVITGSGNPEGVVSAEVGAEYMDTAGTAGNILYIKKTGAGNTGWVITTGAGVTDHASLTSIGTNTHAQIDTHIADGTIHFTEASIDHTAIQNIGSNTHATIDSHLASTSNPHSVTAAQLSLVIGTDVQAWDDDLDDIAALTPTLGAVMIGDGINWTADTSPTLVGDLTLNTNLNLLLTTGAGVGVVEVAGSRFIHTYEDGVSNGDNLFIGVGAGNFTLGGTGSDGSLNTAIGSSAMTSLTTGRDNLSIGSLSCAAVTTGIGNFGLGVRALNKATTSSSNVAVGSSALRQNATGSNNTAIGASAGRGSSGLSNYTNNILIGTNVGFDLLTAGSANVMVGYQAGRVATSATQNILVGFKAGDALTTGAANILIGYDIDAPSNTASNQMSIGNLLFSEGIDGTGTTLSSGYLGIGNAAPAAKCHVDQHSTTAAVPVLYLDQADISEEMIEFNTTIGTGNAIEAIAAKTLTTTHFIKVTLPGALTRYIPCGTIA